MIEDFYRIYEEELEPNVKGDILFLDLAKIKNAYNYAGLWYACDKSEETFITTELYYSESEDRNRPTSFSEEISENSFKHSPRFTLPLKYNQVWIATRVDKAKYCKMKAFVSQSENTYINYRVIQSKGEGFDILSKGIIKGDKADFFKLGIEDGTGEFDYDDTVLFVVMIKNLPPADWRFNASFWGVQKLPLVVPEFLFTFRQKYSSWRGQNPLDNIKI
jgi:hypothetical protein